MSVPSATLLVGLGPWQTLYMWFQTDILLVTKPVEGKLLFPRSSYKTTRVESYWLLLGHMTISDQSLKPERESMLIGQTRSVLSVCGWGWGGVTSGRSQPECVRGLVPQRENPGAIFRRRNAKQTKQQVLPAGAMAGGGWVSEQEG